MEHHDKYQLISNSRVNALHDISKLLFGTSYPAGEKEIAPPAVYSRGHFRPRSEALLLLGMDSLLGWGISTNDLSEYGYKKSLRKNIFAEMNELIDSEIYDKPNKRLTKSGLSELRLILDAVHEYDQNLKNTSPLVAEAIRFLEENMTDIPEKASTEDAELAEKYKIVKRMFLDPVNSGDLSQAGIGEMILQFKEELEDWNLISHEWVSVSGEDTTAPAIKNTVERYLARSRKGSPAAQADSLIRGIRNYAHELKSLKEDEYGESEIRLLALECFACKNTPLIGAMYLKAPELKNDHGKAGNAKANEPDMPRTEIRLYLSHIDSILEQMVLSEAIPKEPSLWDPKELEPLVWLYSGTDLPKDSEKKAFVNSAKVFFLHENGDNEYPYAKSFMNLDFQDDEKPREKKISTEELAKKYPEIAKLDRIIKARKQYSISFPFDDVSKYGPVTVADSAEISKTAGVDSITNGMKCEQ